MSVDFTDSIQYGGTSIRYSVLRVDRTTLEISVHPDMSLILRAPHDVSPEEIRAKVYRRRRWIARKLRFFSQFHPRTVERQYISGETHLYLGRQYKLKVTQDNKKSGVVLGGGYLQVNVPQKDARLVKAALDTWYRDKGRAYFEKVMDHYISEFEGKGYIKPHLAIRYMQTRWGSLSKSGTLTLNPRLVQAPPASVEYVVLHELCHLAEPNHSKKYYDLLENFLPDWKERKQRLEIALS